jgi:hypothetical protein
MRLASTFHASKTGGPLEVLWEDGERAFCRTWRDAGNGARQDLLAVLPAAEYPSPGSIARLTNEYGLHHAVLADEHGVSAARLSARTSTCASSGTSCFAAVRPFSGASLSEHLGHLVHSTPVPPSERAPEPLGTDLEALLLGCLAKEPAAQTQSVQAIAVSCDAPRRADLERG